MPTKLETVTSRLSKEAKAAVAKAREIAIELGYNYISTVHFMLGDCLLNEAYSIRKFIFSTETEFHNFLDGQKIGETTIFAESLPLTKEAEQMLQKACEVWYKYQGSLIYPYHLFLGASLLPQTLFVKSLKTTEDLYQKLEQYYIDIGQLQRETMRESNRGRLIKKLFRRAP